MSETAKLNKRTPEEHIQFLEDQLLKERKVSIELLKLLSEGAKIISEFVNNPLSIADPAFVRRLKAWIAKGEANTNGG